MHKPQTAQHKVNTVNKVKKLQLAGNLLAGIALLISNQQILPDGAFNEGVRLYSFMLILPSIILFITLFAMTYIGLIRVWIFLIAGILLMAGFVVIGMET